MITGQEEGQGTERLYFDDPAEEVVTAEHASADRERARETR